MILGGKTILQQVKSALSKSGNAGRLLTPEEGCGLTKVKNNRIVGGSAAPVGAWPWMTLLGFEKQNKTFFDCGKQKFLKFSSIKFKFV